MARPRFKPTAQMRQSVQAMTAYGIPEEHIARTLTPRGIDPKTLRRHFRRELDVGATLANSTVAQTLFQMATTGKHPAATIFWLKTRAGWRERPGGEEGRAAAAKSAHRGEFMHGAEADTPSQVLEAQAPRVILFDSQRRAADPCAAAEEEEARCEELKPTG